jgi:hypothetical protein
VERISRDLEIVNTVASVAYAGEAATCAMSSCGA